MSFTYPYFIWALLAISLPVIIHLFHFHRFKKTYFSNVALLQFLQNQSQNQNKLREILILICRCLAIFALVFAFAQPYRQKDQKILVNQGVNYVSVALDNSFSMEASTEDGNLLDQAKKAAVDIVKSYRPSDKFHLITMDFSSDYQRFYSQDDMLDLIENVDIQPFFHSLDEILRRQENVLLTSDNPNRMIFMLSDFQKSVFDFSDIRLDSTIQAFMLPFTAAQINNLSVDSIHIESPVLQVGNTIDVQIFITNYGEHPIDDVPVKLLVDDKTASVGSVSLDAKQTKMLTWPLNLTKAGVMQACVEIVDYPISFDDKFYFSLNILEKIPVLVISENQPNPYLNKLLSVNSSVKLTTLPLSQLDYAELKNNNFVVLSELNDIPSALSHELAQTVEQGMSLLFIPGKQTNLSSVNALINPVLNSELDSIKTMDLEVSDLLSSHPIYSSAFVKLPDNLFLPKIHRYYPLKLYTRSNLIKLMTLNNGDPFLVRSDYGKGAFYLLSTPLAEEFSDFQHQPIFVVSLLNMIFQSASNQSYYNILSEQQSVELRSGELNTLAEALVLKSTDFDFEMIPYVRYQGQSLFLNTYDAVKEAGNYGLYSKNELISGLSYNYDRKESLLDVYTKAELNTTLSKENLNHIFLLKEKNNNQENSVLVVDKTYPLWKICLLLALIFLLTELVFLRKR